VSRKVVDKNLVAFRPFTDDADKVSETYEPIVRELLSPRPSEVIIDVGANIGVHTVWLSRKVGPSGLIIAVEPEQTNFLILTLNKWLNRLNNVLTIRVALASSITKGELVIPRPSLMGQASTHALSYSSKSYVVSVNFETLDNIIFAQEISTVSAIKIDVEGAETSILQGAEKTIKKFGPRLIIEAHGDENLRSIRLLLKSMKMIIVSETIATSRSDENRHFVFAIPDSNLDYRQRN
jgi:FkbM family methyltransferase